MGTNLRAAFLLSVIGGVLGALAAKPPTILPGLQLDGSVLLPNQWSLRPVGPQTAVGDFPVNVALHPDGDYAAVLHSGWGQHEVRIIDLKTHKQLSQVALEEAYYGLAWSPDGKELYASGAGRETIHCFNFKDGYLSAHHELRLHDAKVKGVPAGLAVSADGAALYVAESWGQRVLKVSLADGRVGWSRELAAPQGGAMNPEGERTESHDDPEAPFPYTCLPDEKHGRVFVSLWAKSAVLVLDARTGVEIARWPVGAHPNEMVLARDGRLFVAEANLNTVSVLDPKNGQVLETLTASLFPNSPPGSMPNSLALSPDGELLFVANANNNNVAVFNVATPRHAQSLGFIPVGWFPTSVRVARDGQSLVIANGKGANSLPNPRGPFPGRDPRERPGDLREYIGGLLRGTVEFVALPTEKQRAEQFGAWTKIAYACSPLDATLTPRGERSAHNPIPAKLGDASPIRHVIYVVRENRTYDQVLGDMTEGNGDARLCLFGESVTPNAHALAREFVLLDNFFADGEVSADGHEWTMGAQATDFVEKLWPLNYGHGQGKKNDYPSEGRWPVAYPANGYLWNRAAEAGVTFRSYGEFCHTPTKGDILSEPTLPVLKGHIDPYYKAWDLGYPDCKRVERFTVELRRFEAEGDMPRLQVVRLGGDHTEGTSAGRLTPTAHVAENDAALGQLVGAISHSKFWADTVVCVLEDDAQNGSDHVDAHRMPAFVISPWTKRHAVDSTLYSTTSMLRTIELILGLQPMSQFDAAAMPLWNAFAAQPDLTAYTAKPAQVDLDARNTKLAWGARESGKMDFTEPDRADDIKLNEIVWRSVRGPDSRMPAPVRAAFFKAHPKTDDDDL